MRSPRQRWDRLVNTQNARREKAGSFDHSLAHDLEKLDRAVSRLDARSTAFIRAWNDLMPAELVASTQLKSLRRGTAVILVENAGTAYEIDRLLRTGIEHRLREALPFTLTRLRTEIGRLDDVPPARSSA